MKSNLFKNRSYYFICIILFISCNKLISNIDFVKGSAIKTDYSMKIGEALDNYKYFIKTEWKEFTTKQGKEVVEFNGYYNKKNLVVRIQFVMNKDRQEDADGVNFRVGFEGYKFLNQTDDESRSLPSLMSDIYENKEISWFSSSWFF